MFNGFRSEAFLNNFNAPLNPSLTAIGGTVTTYPTNPRTNLCTNPGFEYGLDGWTRSGLASAITSSTTQYYYGTKSLSVTYTLPTNWQMAEVTSPPMQFYAGKTYSFSAQVLAPIINRSYISGYDYMGYPIYSSENVSRVSLSVNGTYGSGFASFAPTGGWVNMSATLGPFPYDSVGTLSIRFSSTYAMSGTFTGYVDNVLVEEGNAVNPYFDGDTVDCHWNGSKNGSTSTQNVYKIHTFTSNGTFDISSLGSTFNSVEYLVVAGGGAGGNYNGGGGGAGGMLTNVGGTLLPVTLGSYPVVVGAGGVGTAYPNPGGNGGNSSVLGLTAIGGGGGGAPWGNGVNNEAGGRAGGSGGGAGYNTNYIASGGAGTAGQGNKGGDGAI